jgi:tRNA dimethylallyltransferase
MKNNIIVICGPTATGKSDYAVQLAREINGEIISADSRQVYKGLDIGSGKITQKEMRGVPHHLLDVANPKRVFSVARYKKLADQAIQKILKKGKTPIIVGGTGFYIDAVVFDQQFPAVKANPALRKKLEKQSLIELQVQLQLLDPERFEDIDIKNKVRLIRAIEIVAALGKVPKTQPSFAKAPSSPEATNGHSTAGEEKYEVQWIYLDFPDEVLKQRIHDRLLKRMRKGMVKEVQRLHTEGVAWSRLEALGLEYRFIALYLQKKPFDKTQSDLSMNAMLSQLETAIWHYAKRQRTWFKKYAK